MDSGPLTAQAHNGQRASEKACAPTHHPQPPQRHPPWPSSGGSASPCWVKPQLVYSRSAACRPGWRGRGAPLVPGGRQGEGWLEAVGCPGGGTQVAGTLSQP